MFVCCAERIGGEKNSEREIAKKPGSNAGHFSDLILIITVPILLNSTLRSFLHLKGVSGDHVDYCCVQMGLKKFFGTKEERKSRFSDMLPGIGLEVSGRIC